MEKITNTSTMPKELEIPVTWLDARRRDSLDTRVKLKEWRELMINTMWDYLETNDQLLLEDFLLKYRIHRTTMWRWRQRYKDLDDEVQAIKIFIAARRKNGNYRGTLRDSVWKDMHEYDPEWQRVNDYNDNREIRKSVEIKKQDDQDKHGTIIVQMTKFTEEK